MMRKKDRFILFAVCLCLLLCSCSHGKQIPDDTSLKRDSAPTEITVAQDVVEPPPTERESDDRQDEEEMSRLQSIAESAKKKAESLLQEQTVMGTYKTTYEKEFTLDGVTYTASYSNSWDTLIGVWKFVSEEEEITIPSELDGQPLHSVSFAVADLPNLKTLTLSDGITMLSAGAELPRLEVLHIPASLTGFYGRSEEVWEAVETHFLYQIHRVIPALDPETMDSGERMHYRLIAMELSGYGNLGAMPLTALPSLKEVHVAQGNETFWVEDGMLYSDRFARMAPNMGAEPIKQLIGVPGQFTPSTTANVMKYTVDENGNQKPAGWTHVRQLEISEGTDYIHSGAVYRPMTYSRIKIPDSVTRIAPAAIVGSEANPLTVVCSRGSAAEAYVKQFGKQYHLQLG